MAEAVTSTKVVATQATATVAQPAPNPLLDSKNIGELCGLILVIAAVMALINKAFDNKARTREEKHQVEHERLNDRISDHKHDIAEAKQKIVALEHFRQDDISRIVKVESELQAIKEGQTEIKHSLDSMRQESKDGRKELVDAIRRLQDAALKPRADDK